MERGVPGNPFLRLIERGTITDLDGLRGAYRRLLIRTHPDRAGTDDLLPLHVSLGRHFEEACHLLEARAAAEACVPARVNPRRAFFQHLAVVEALDLPYAFHVDEHAGRIRGEKLLAAERLREWRPDLVPLYEAADLQLTALKRQKPSGPYLRHALALNVRPVLHNLTAYHLTGRGLYRRQIRQNLVGVLDRLEGEGDSALVQFLRAMVDDMETNGPAAAGTRSRAAGLYSSRPMGNDGT